MWHLGLLYAAQIVGWVYFVSWSVSFYPQIYLNWKRKSVVGFSFDMALMDVLGFLAYTIYTVTLYCDASLQKYFHSLENQHFRDRDNTVKLTDVVFASHGLIMAFITVSQVLIYERGNQRLSKIAGGLCSLGSLGFVVLVIVAASKRGQSVSNWASPLIYAGYFKSGLSFIKCVPQVYLSASRRSTEGYNILGVWLDFVGGVFSLVQMILYCVIDEDNAQLTGNIPKLVISIESLLFDAIFIFQHYICYASRRYTLQGECLIN